MRPGIRMIASRSLRHHWVSTLVSAVSVGLAAGLLMSITVIQSESLRGFTSGAGGFDAVVGARGSALQLVLNTVFHLETSPGNIPWSIYSALKIDRRVAAAIPYAVGDNYRGYRIVGTTPEVFEILGEKMGRGLFTAGGAFDAAKREAVIGSMVAEKAGLSLGSVIEPYHGVDFDEKKKHEERYVVTGILAPSGTASDRVVWIPIEGILRMGGHVLRGTGEEYHAEAGTEIPDEHKEVSAVMLKLKGPESGFLLEREINRQGKVATVVWPISRVMADLFQKMGWGIRILQVVAGMVGIVASASIFAGVYNTIRERRREFAILRALGARRRAIFGIIMLESTAISLIGSACGYLFHFLIVTVIASMVRAETGVIISANAWHPILAWTPLGMVLLGGAAGMIPAISAYRTDVSSHLTAHS